MAKGILLRLVDGVTPLANLSGLICLWWDQTDVYEFDTPIGRTDSATTDSDGYLKLDISNVSGVSVGNYGFLVVHKEEIDANYKKAPVFASIVEVRECEGGTRLVYSVEEYVRPVDWISLGTLPTETDNKFIGLHAVFKDGPNWCAFKFTCSDSSQYTVDWGDGTSNENIDSGTTAYHSFNYNNLAGNTETGISEARAVTFQDTGDTITLSNHGFDNGTEISFSSIVTTTGISTYTRYYVVNVSGNTFQVSDTKGGTAKTLTTDGTGAVYLPGYRQSLVTVTPTTTGKAFTALDLKIQHTSASTVFGNPTGWLDICLAAPSMTSLIIGASTNNIRQGMLERFNAVSNGAITDFSYMFFECYSLQDVWLNTSSGTNFIEMFASCNSLKSIPLLDTSSGTNFNTMFDNCYALQLVPLLDTSSGTDFGNMFQDCYALKSVPLLDTSNGTIFADMFEYCYSLKSVPLLDTSSGTVFSYMFWKCTSLKSVPLLDTSSGIYFDGMFNGCNSLGLVPILDTSSGTIFTDMFSYCYSLQSVPLLDTSSGTDFSYMFYNCYALKSIPLLDTSSGIYFYSMFRGSYFLQSVPLLDTSSGIDFDNMFNGCNSLGLVPILDTSSGTDFSNMFSYCYSLQIGTLFGTSRSISYASCNLSLDALHEIFENLASTTNSPSITITGNWSSTKVSLSGTTTSGNSTVTMADTTGLSANMWITGTGISNSRDVSFQDSGNTITLSSHGISNGTRIAFSGIAYTTGIEINRIYYVVNADTNTFQVSDTAGGSAKELTNDGVGVLLYETYIVSVTPNTSITLSIPASSSATNTLVSTTLNPYLATLKGWTVVN